MSIFIYNTCGIITTEYTSKNVSTIFFKLFELTKCVIIYMYIYIYLYN